jgi:septum formation protein
MKLVLASTSPRRREILALLGVSFEVIEPDFDENVSPDQSIRDQVLEIAVGKASSVARRNPASIVIGSDTMILLDEKKIGKPDGIAHAREILRSLAGKTHRIFTSVAMLDSSGGPDLGIVEEVLVKMRDYSEEEIERYLACDESLDKAGGYSIQGQGRDLIESIRGDYLAAVGLPLKPIAEYLKNRGITVPLDVEKLYADKSFLNWQSF